MSNYTKTTDFAAKDSLPSGDSGKIIKGAEFETEFDAISNTNHYSRVVIQGCWVQNQGFKIF